MPSPPIVINFDPSVDLIERIEDYSPGTACWSKTDVSDLLVYDVIDGLSSAVSKWPDFLMYTLGTEYVGGDNYLHRTKPMQHPRFDYLFARRVADSRGVKYAGKDAGHDQGGPVPVPSARYKYTRAHVEFWQPPLSYKNDQQIIGPVDLWDYSSTPGKRTTNLPQEWLRWCDTGGWSPYGDFISIEGSTLSFAENPLAGPAIVGNPIPGAIGWPISKAGYTIKWYNVPAEYLFSGYINGTYGIPANILAGVNRVNAFSWFGFAPGTLLLDPPKFEYFVSPVSTGGDPQYLYNVEFPFRFFDPIKGVPTSPYHGWQLLPYGPDGKWYLATRNPPDGTGTKGSTSNPFVYGWYPMSYLFLPPISDLLNPISAFGKEGAHD